MRRSCAERLVMLGRGCATFGPRPQWVEPLPKVPQILNSRTFDWKSSKERFGQRGDITGPLTDTQRSDAYRRKVAAWTPVVKTMGDRRLRVALVGRMNSGKSSLFNALTSDPLVPNRGNTVKNFDGITRDAVEGHGQLGGMYFTLIDTPGIVGGKIVEEALRAISTADVALVVSAVDQDIASDEVNLVRFLEAKGLPTVAVLNKMDLVPDEEQDRVVAAYNVMGAGNVVPISVRRDEGMEMLQACIEPLNHLHIMDQRESDWDVEDLALSGDEAAMDEVRERNSAEQFIRIAIVGRTNSGKSSLINRLVGYERTRSSSETNTTRDAVEIPCAFRGRKLKLIDTAGATRTRFRADREFIGLLHKKTINEIRFAHVCIVVFDATEGHPNKYDMSLMHEIAREGRPALLCANKWDAVLDPSATAEAIDFKIKRQAHEIKYCQAVVTSAHTGMNLTLVLDQALELYDKWNRRVRSNELTRFWRRMEKSVVIPHHVARIGRLSQVNVRPPTFLARLQSRSTKNHLPPTLEEMLKNALIEEFGFRGVPVRILQEEKDSHPDYI